MTVRNRAAAIPSRAGFGVLCLLTLASSVPARAQSAVEEFYKGKQITLYVGYSPGGGYDTYARLVAQFMGEHIPGKPSIIVKNMAGGGSRVACGYMYNVAPRDGTALATADQSLTLQQAIGDKTIQFDNNRFHWIGNPDQDNNTLVTWHTSGVRTIADAKSQTVSVATTGPNTTSAQYPVIMNLLLGTKFKIVHGYPGANDANMAMERGEVHGRGSYGWATGKATRPAWPKEGKINVLVQIGLTKSSELPNVPLIMDLATNADDRAVLRLLSAPVAIGKPLFTTPDVPAERVAALRKAFDATMADPGFKGHIERNNMSSNPVPGTELQKIVGDIISAPEPVRHRLAELLAKAGE